MDFLTFVWYYILMRLSLLVIFFVLGLTIALIAVIFVVLAEYLEKK